jgi:peptidoglycan hydrolase-like protein with peptidoglycan-binding domain
VPITGFFGPRTRAMIAAWQKKQSVPETGFLTATQWTALQQQAVAAASKRQETPQPQADVAGAPVDARQAEAHETALGLTEADRKRAQTALTALGHDVAPITGFFGPRTRAMIAAWQKKQGLPETGYLSAAQWRALQQQAAPALAKLDAEQPKADIDRRQAEAEEAGLGLSEHDRKRVQVALSSLGHEIGATTGFIGPRTRAMITAWQRQQGLPETGYLSAAQWQALQRQAAPALAKYEAAQR